MTTRLFRLWQPGNPRRRVFLPNFWMAPVKPHEHEFLRKNQVKFACPMEMTEWDVREYLTKIYDLPVRDVKMKAEQGKIYFTLPDYRAGVAREKEHDQMYAYVTLKRGVEFKFPNVFVNDMNESSETMHQRLDEARKKYRESQTPTRRPDKEATRSKTPQADWFSI